MKSARVFCLLLVVFGGSLALGAPTVFTDFASFDAASNAVLTEDFESLASSLYDKPLASFTSNGITYTGLAGKPFPNVYVASPTNPHFVVDLTSHVLTANGAEDFAVELSLSSPVTALGFDTYLNSSGPATIEVWSGATLLATLTYGHDATEVGFLGITAIEGITKIRWTTVGGQTVNTGIDNIWTGAVVPAPGALMLGSLGAGIVGWLRRRRAM